MSHKRLSSTNPSARLAHRATSATILTVIAFMAAGASCSSGSADSAGTGSAPPTGGVPSGSGGSGPLGGADPSGGALSGGSSHGTGSTGGAFGGAPLGGNANLGGDGGDEPRASIQGIYAQGSQYLAIAERSWDGHWDWEERRNFILASSDGENWSIVYEQKERWLTGAAFGDDLWVVVGATEEHCRVLTSSDGVNWEAQSVPASRSCSSVNWMGTEFVVLGLDEEGRRTLWSYDGKDDWSMLAAEPDLVPEYEVIAKAGIWVGFVRGANHDGFMLHSWDEGLTWEKAASNVRTPVAVWREEDKFVGKSLSFPSPGSEPFPPIPYVLESSDGLDWTSVLDPDARDAVVPYGDFWFGIERSTEDVQHRPGLDGEWTSAAEIKDSLNWIAAGEDRLIVASANDIWWSANGKKWTRTNLPNLLP